MRTGETGQNVLYNSVSGEVRYTTATTATASYSGTNGGPVTPSTVSLAAFALTTTDAGTGSLPFVIGAGSTNGQLFTIVTTGTAPNVAYLLFTSGCYDASGILQVAVFTLGINRTVTAFWYESAWYLISGTVV